VRPAVSNLEDRHAIVYETGDDNHTIRANRRSRGSGTQRSDVDGGGGVSLRIAGPTKVSSTHGIRSMMRRAR
jgi:hypothetical protein